MSAIPSLSGAATAVVPVPAPAKPRARGFLHIVRYGAGPNSVYVLTYHRLPRPALAVPNNDVILNLPAPAGETEDSSSPYSARGNGVILSGAKDLSSIDHRGDRADRENVAHSSEPEPRPKPILAEGAQALIDLLERIGVDFHLAEVRGALEDILRLGSANIPDLWLSDDDLLAKGLAES